MSSTGVYDVFLSHGSPDKPWVETLASELNGLGLTTFLDVREIEAADSFPLVLDGGLAGSRFLVLILSPHSDRPWVRKEWAAFMAHHGPERWLIPVLLEPTEVPALLEPIQRIDATDRDAARVAREIARIAGRPDELKEGDARRLVLGQDLVFNLASEEDGIKVTDPTGRTRTVTPPWKVDNQFGLALHFYDRLTREPMTADADRTDLFRRATTLGSLLFGVLFDEQGIERLKKARVPGRPRPLITIRSADDSLLALPWELLHHEGSFLLRDARIDLARSTPGEVIPFQAMIARTAPATAPEIHSAAARLYDSIFPSYSHQDQQIVERIGRAYRALGLTYLRDITTLRSGEAWQPRILELIEQANAFQLFWSRAAAESKYVTEEWQAALRLIEGKKKEESFIRPVYWQEPMTAVPPALGKIHFAFEPDLMK